MKLRRFGCLVGALMVWATATALALQPAAAFDLSGKRVTIIVPFDEGGGTDVYARFIAPSLRQHLPGQPTINILNQPGGGGITGSNRFDQTAKPDGLTILAVSTSTILNAVLDDARVRYKPAEWVPIITSPLGGVIFTSPKTGVTKPEEVAKLTGQKLVFGANTPRGADATRLLMFDMLDLDLNVVFGIGAAPARQAFERGEFSLGYETTAAYLRQVVPLIEAGKAVPIFAYGYIDEDGKLGRDPTFPDLPHFGEAYESIHGKEPSGADYEVLLTLLNIQVMANKSLVLPTGTPTEIVETYRTAMRKVLDDPEFQKVKEQAIGAYPQAIGKAAETVLQRSSVMDPEAKAWLTDWLEKKYGVKP